MTWFKIPHFWLFTRCAIYVWSFASAVLESPRIPSKTLSLPEPVSSGFFIFASFMVATFLLFLFFTALVFAAGISLSSLGFGTRVNRPWVKPRHFSNPFSFSGPPLVFLHFAAFSIIAAGLGLYAGAIFSGIAGLLGGSLVTAFGGAILGGLHFGMACCRNRFAKPNESD